MAAQGQPDGDAIRISQSHILRPRSWQVWLLVDLLLLLVVTQESSALSTTVPQSLDKRQQRTPHRDEVLGYRRGPEDICKLMGFFNTYYIPSGKEVNCCICD
jgi:hypothetical protein